MVSPFWKNDLGYFFITDSTGESKGPFKTKQDAREQRKKWLSAKARTKIGLVIRE